MLSSSAASDISSPEVMRQLAATITASLTSSSSAPSSSSAQAVVSTPQTPARPPAPVATPVPHTTPTQPAAQAPPAMQPVAATQAPGPVAGGPTGMPVASVVERPVPTPVLPLPALAAGGAPSSSPLQSAVPVPMQLIQNMPTPLPQPQLAAAAATQPMDPSLVYRNRTVVDLKALLRSRGLRQTGLKADLVRRLVEDDAKRGKGPNAQPTVSYSCSPPECLMLTFFKTVDECNAHANSSECSSHRCNQCDSSFTHINRDSTSSCPDYTVADPTIYADDCNHSYCYVTVSS